MLGVGCVMLVGGVAWGILPDQNELPRGQDTPELSEGEVIAAVEEALISRGRLSWVERTTATYWGDGRWTGFTRGQSQFSELRVDWCSG